MRKNALSPRTVKLLAALVVLGLAGALSALAAAGSSPVSTPRLGGNVNVPADKAAAMADRMPSAPIDATAPAGPAATAAFAPDPIPAGILGSNVPVPISSSILTETNGWLVSNGYNLVAVYAGSAGDDPTQGRVVIVRQDLRAGRQTVQIVDAGTTGPLTIAADAPTGAAVETTALTGALKLGTSRGAPMKLNLSTNTVSAR
ncbi:MAG TPA: hypothetical protein VMU72_01480 [Gaiellaceae bacterium]|nr:hypothetical protein [Gaiellaceae bacterium]HVC87688.1 hypothetical protein [Gaiellaceae bacterium]